MRRYSRAASRHDGEQCRRWHPTWANTAPPRKVATLHSGSCSCNINKIREAADKLTQIRNVCSSICRLIVALIIPFRLHQLADAGANSAFSVFWVVVSFFFLHDGYLILKTSGLDCIVIVIPRNSSGRSAEWRRKAAKRDERFLVHMRQSDRRTSAPSEPKHHVGITGGPVEEAGIGLRERECKETEEMTGRFLSHCMISQTEEMTK